MEIKAIKTEEDYGNALKRLDAIFDSMPNSPEGNELEILAALIDNYEKVNFPINNENS